jgi:hypothetical protein
MQYKGVVIAWHQKVLRPAIMPIRGEKFDKLNLVQQAGVMLATTLKADYIGRDYWRDKAEYERMRRRGSFKGSSLFFVGAAHLSLWLNNFLVV